CRARQAVSSASALLDPGVPAKLAHPPAEAIELARAVVSAFAEAGYGRTPEAAANVILNAIRKLQEQAAASDAGLRSGRVGCGCDRGRDVRPCRRASCRREVMPAGGAAPAGRRGASRRYRRAG